VSQSRIDGHYPGDAMNHKTMRPYIFIDGLNVFIRHYLVNETLNSKSEPIGGAVGFLKFVDYITRVMTPSKVFVVWESGGGSARRRSIFKEYKKDRGKIKELKKIHNGTASIRDQLANDEECKIKQLSLIYKLLKNTPVCQVFVSGTECDDIIAYLVKHQFSNNGDIEKIVVSGDKDFYQLLDDDTVKIYDPARKTLLDGDWVFKKFGIAPRNFCLARALVGDKSDNIEGVPGVGLKTVAKRFPDVADRTRDLNVDDILKTCDEQITSKAKQKVFKQIKESESIVRRNWKLMFLSSNMLSGKEISKINYAVESHEPKMNKVNLIKEVIANGISIAFDYDTFSTQMRMMASVSDSE